MKKISLSCFDGFKCKASSCRDNCCIGWEIDIDEMTAEKYRAYKGALAQRFKDDIVWSDAPYFKLSKEGRCPFLNDNNLCDIIALEGEDMLCEICAKHPRFYEWLPGITLEGYGIGCEKACNMLLSCDKQINFTVSEITDEIQDEETDDVLKILLDTQKCALLLVQNRNLDINRRMMALLSFASSVQNALEAENYGVIETITELYSDEAYVVNNVNALSRLATEDAEWHYGKIIDFYRSLERLDEKWSSCLDSLQREFKTVHRGKNDEKWQRKWENMSVYLIFRYFMKSYYDEDVLSRAKLVVLSYFTAGLLMRAAENDAEQEYIAKTYSKEIEYSDENVEKLLDESYENISFSLKNMMAILIKIGQI